ncbi:MAG TPA: hypothetical protein VNT81_02480, partial [Vicinamibacterales bacterium]|nr:hypothetical protein [Vicinamibacterales bacterium]
MAVRIAAIIVTAFLGGQAVAQPALPTFTRQQRELLQAIVTAVDASPGRPEVPDMNWRHHVLRASDGSHYVAFSLTPAPQPVAATIMLYVRLVPSNPQGVTQSPRRSAVQE